MGREDGTLITMRPALPLAVTVHRIHHAAEGDLADAAHPRPSCASQHALCTSHGAQVWAAPLSCPQALVRCEPGGRNGAPPSFWRESADGKVSLAGLEAGRTSPSFSVIEGGIRVICGATLRLSLEGSSES